jgi:hypothetical protein
MSPFLISIGKVILYLFMCNESLLKYVYIYMLMIFV